MARGSVVKMFGVAVIALLALPAVAASQTVKIGWIDPLSGGAAATGEAGLKHFQYIAEQINAKGGVLGMKFEVLGYDNKLNPQESLIAAQKAIDAGARILLQGNGSNVAAALVDFVTKYNDRNPGKEVVYLNYAAVDPVLTNDKCSYWHFRFDANSDIKMEALTNYMKGRPDIKKLYLINQDYSFGQAVRAMARQMIAEKRPDVQIVGDELHPLQKITDFSPYVAKIRASGADSVITGNWSQDFSLLIKAAADAGLQANWYTYYAAGTGGPTAVRQANLPDRVFEVAEGNANIPNASSQQTEREFRAKLGQPIIYPRAFNVMKMLAQAIDEAKSPDPKKFAPKLEKLKITVFDGGEGFMRSDDHQFFQPMYISSFGPTGADRPFDMENTGWGWKAVGKIEPEKTVLQTSCKMERPR